MAYPGLTRDALPPRRVATATADGDADGKLDAIDIEWSERVTGATGTAPVHGRRPDARRQRELRRVDHTRSVRRGPGAVRHRRHAERLLRRRPGRPARRGRGRSATRPRTRRAVATETPLDKAAPILVAAKTADLTTPSAGNVPNGTIDAVLTTFSEPISHPPDAFSPFSLNVAGRSEVDVEGDTGARRPDALRARHRGGVAGRRPDAERLGAGRRARPRTASRTARPRRTRRSR